MPLEEEWAYRALAHLGDEHTVRALAPLLRDWHRSTGHPRARLGLDIIFTIGGDVAFSQLNEIAQTPSLKALQRKARGLLDDWAACARSRE
jgi:hypothetical protein